MISEIVVMIVLVFFVLTAFKRVSIKIIITRWVSFSHLLLAYYYNRVKAFLMISSLFYLILDVWLMRFESFGWLRHHATCIRAIEPWLNWK